MQLARVLGQVVATMKDPGLDSFKLLIVTDVDPGDPEADGAAPSYLAVDLVGAGEDEIVVVSHGGAARIPEASRQTPTDRAVVAIVDDVVVGGRVTFKK
jgi:ethanolamine utilization protein EutN